MDLRWPAGTPFGERTTGDRHRHVLRDLPGEVAVTEYLDLGASTAALQGPQELTLAQVTEIIGGHQGRDVRYVDESIDEAYDSRQAYRAPQWQLDAWVSTYEGSSGTPQRPEFSLVHRD